MNLFYFFIVNPIKVTFKELRVRIKIVHTRRALSSNVWQQWFLTPLWRHVFDMFGNVRINNPMCDSIFPFNEYCRESRRRRRQLRAAWTKDDICGKTLTPFVYKEKGHVRVKLGDYSDGKQPMENSSRRTTVPVRNTGVGERGDTITYLRVHEKRKK